MLLKALGSVIESEKVSQAINAFSMAAILSSFIGVGLGVFDFLADLFKFGNCKRGRSKTWLVTFLPPLILSLLFPFGFIIAIGYAGAAATVWACIIPVLLAYKSRSMENGYQGFLLQMPTPRNLRLSDKMIVVTHQNECALVVGQRVSQCLFGFQIEMIVRFIQQ